ncbi:MAG TPA: hypothetical protein VE971_01755 [Candidatus Eisenbacteria bacterium]|nr:hypothetical protein [Candidatus Eisenbacteria bacterium]
MIPGIASKVSEVNVSLTTTLQQTSDVMRVTSTTSTTQFNTIIPAFGNLQAVVLFLENKSGNSITALTTGNIAGAGSFTILSNRMAVLVFSALEGKWSICQDT